MADDQATLHELMKRHAQEGTVTWIGVRPERHASIRVLDRVEAVAEQGLRGDRYKTTRNGKRQVTLIQGEHLPVMAALLGIPDVAAEQLRRNIVVCGINVLSLKNQRFTVGDVLLEGSGLCAPCSQMEATFGEGGYNAMRGHGGITAKIVRGGWIQRGDVVRLAADE